MTVRPSVLRLSLIVFGFVLALAAAPTPASSGGALGRVLMLPEAALLVEVAGRPVIARGAERAMVPASTMKLVTALAAIERWGLDHQFTTELYVADDWLWMRASGDPFLVSEELDLLARALARTGLRRLAGIGIDDRLYAPDLRIPGRSASDNPYDAPVTAFAVNFNTLHLRVAGGALASGERQTPLTPLAREFGGRLGTGTHRINLRTRELALRYAGELLAAKLAAAGVAVGPGQRVGPLPGGAERVLIHRNSRDLRLMLEAMLEHSNNFIANQLFLLLAAERDGEGVDMLQAQRAMSRWLEGRFGWRDFRVEDGAGLSRGNRLSARQLVEVLEAFAPYRALLPVQAGNPAVRAKTGTLTGVSAYAGYLRGEAGWAPFALLINQRVDPALRRQVADELARTRPADLEIICAGGRC